MRRKFSLKQKEKLVGKFNALVAKGMSKRDAAIKLNVNSTMLNRWAKEMKPTVITYGADPTKKTASKVLRQAASRANKIAQEKKILAIYGEPGSVIKVKGGLINE